MSADLAELWELERRCWVDGRSYYQEILTSQSVFCFPPPMGIFKGTDFVEQMGEAGPFTSVDMKDQHVRDFGSVIALAYVGVGRSDEKTIRHSNCSSVWEKTDTGWKLAVHHQTLLD